MMYPKSNHRRPCSRSNINKTTWPSSLSHKQIFTPQTTTTTTILTFSALLLAANLLGQPTSGLVQQDPSSSSSLLITQDNPPPLQTPSLIAQQSQTINQVVPAQQQEILVQPNSQVRIECKLPQLPEISASGKGSKSRTFYWNFQRSSASSHQNNNKPELLCFRDECHSSNELGLDIDKANLASNGAYDLIINNATYERNDGVYYCEYKDEHRGTISREFRLTVLIQPQPPTISAASSAPAKEGLEYQLNCVSFGGNPEPNITWFRNEQPVGPASLPGARIEQSRVNGSTTSSLTWLVSMEDNNANYRCSVANKAMNGLAPFERELSLPVEYAPRISVGPFNPLKVMQGERVTISCQVDANPPVKGIRWFYDNRPISNHYNHSLHDVKISDAGFYSCQADNGIAPPLQHFASPAASAPAPSSGFFAFLGLSSTNQQVMPTPDGPLKTSVEARLQLEVLYPPRVQVKSSQAMPLKEGDFFTLNCSADSWPPAHEFVWSKLEGQELRQITSGPSPALEFQSVSAADMANYTCTAINRLEPSGTTHSVQRQASGSSLVLIQHKPGTAEISLGQAGETELGNKTFIQCRAKPPGYPQPEYTFWKYTDNNKKYLGRNPSSTYTIYSAKPTDEGRYGCSADNSMGPSSEAEGELVVNEVPTIIPDSNRRPEDERAPGDGPYSITVRATGKPQPKVAWFHRSPADGRKVPLDSVEMMSRFKIDTQVSSAENGRPSSRGRFTVLSTLTFKSPLEVDDRGLYSVEFSNGLSRVAVEQLKLHIVHPPMPINSFQLHQQLVNSQGGSGGVRSLPVTSNAPATTTTGSVATSEGKQKFGFNVGELANLTCRVSAFPEPQFVWYGANDEKSLDGNSRYKTSSRNLIDDIWEGSLSFVMASDNDYSEYMCVSANTDQKTHQISEGLRTMIELVPKSAPGTPSQVEQVDAGEDSVTLQWVPGFDGGFAQNQFLIQYAPEETPSAAARRSVNNDNLKNVLDSSADQSAYDPSALLPTIQDNQASSGQQWPQLFNCHSSNPCTINNLSPRHVYIMRVRAANQLGSSDFSEEIRVQTIANMSQVPRIIEASLDSNNVLHYRIEPNSEYLLSNLQAKIEVRLGSLVESANKQQQQPFEQAEQTQTEAIWRPQTIMAIRQERGEIYLNMQPNSEQLRITLCSRTNESLCGPEFVLSAKSATSSFLQDQRGLSLSILMSTVILIILLGAFATTVHTCCLSRKAKKAAALDRADQLNGNLGSDATTDNNNNNSNHDTKPTSGGHTNGGLTTGSHKGSTSTTNSVVGANNHLSMDSIHQRQHHHLASNLQHHQQNGSASDHSSDHSRQAKLDSMLPPNYNHYADRASLMLEQQQQAAYLQQQQHQQQDKLASPFGLPASALIGQQQQPSPMMMAASGQAMNHFGFNSHLSSLEQQQMAMDGMGSMLNQQQLEGLEPASLMDQQHHLWDQQQQQHHSLDDYHSNYNTLAAQSYPGGQEQQLIESAYGTTTGVAPGGANGLVMAQHQQAAYDNSANQFYLASPAGYGSQQDPSQYQQEIAAAQQQMYGTLTRNGYNSNNNNTTTTTTNNNSLINTSQEPTSHLSNQQSSPPTALNEQYMSTNGLIQPPPPPIESDYGTTGATRGGAGRLIREIIV